MEQEGTEGHPPPDHDPSPLEEVATPKSGEDASMDGVPVLRSIITRSITRYNEYASLHKAKLQREAEIDSGEPDSIGEPESEPQRESESAPEARPGLNPNGKSETCPSEAPEESVGSSELDSVKKSGPEPAEDQEEGLANVNQTSCLVPTDEESVGASNDIQGPIPELSYGAAFVNQMYICDDCRCLGRGYPCGCPFPRWFSLTVFEQVFSHISWESRVDHNGVRLVIFFYIMSTEIRDKLDSAGELESCGRGSAPSGSWWVYIHDLPLPMDLPDWMMALHREKDPNYPKYHEQGGRYDFGYLWSIRHINLHTQVVMICFLTEHLGVGLACCSLCDDREHVFVKAEAAHDILQHLRWERRVDKRQASSLMFTDSWTRSRPGYAAKARSRGELVASGYGLPDGLWNTELEDLPDKENLIEVFQVAQEDEYLLALEKWSNKTIESLDSFHDAEQGYVCDKCGAVTLPGCLCLSSRLTAAKRVRSKVTAKIRAMRSRSLAERRTSVVRKTEIGAESDSEPELSRILAPGSGKHKSQVELVVGTPSISREELEKALEAQMAKYRPVHHWHAYQRDDCPQCWRRIFTRDSSFSCPDHPAECPEVLPSLEARQRWATPNDCPNCKDRANGVKCKLCKFRIRLVTIRFTTFGVNHQRMQGLGCLSCDHIDQEQRPCSYCYHERDLSKERAGLKLTPTKICTKRLLFGEKCCECILVYGEDELAEPAVTSRLMTVMGLDPTQEELAGTEPLLCRECGMLTDANRICSTCPSQSRMSGDRAGDCSLNLPTFCDMFSWKKDRRVATPVSVNDSTCPDCNSCVTEPTGIDSLLLAPEAKFCLNPCHRKASTPIMERPAFLRSFGHTSLGSTPMELDEGESLAVAKIVQGGTATVVAPPPGFETATRSGEQTHHGVDAAFGHIPDVTPGEGQTQANASVRQPETVQCDQDSDSISECSCNPQ